MDKLGNLVAQIKKTFTRGALYEYLQQNPRPDAEVILEYLSYIEHGSDPHYSDEEAQVKAYALQQKLQLLKENKNLYFVK